MWAKGKLNVAVVGAMALAVLISGCASTDPVRVEEDFGESVRHMIQAQTANPNPPADPAASPSGGMDGKKSDAVIEAYRKHTSNPGNVERPITISIGK